MNSEINSEKTSLDERSKKELLIENLRHQVNELNKKLSQAEILLETARQRVSWFESK